MSNAEQMSLAAYRALVEANDKAVAELAAQPIEARYRADLDLFGCPEAAMRAVAIRVRDTKRLNDTVSSVKAGD